MKKYVLSAIIVPILLSQCFVCHAADISARCAIVIEASTGTVLYEKNADEPRGMASTTKIMTALLAVESKKTADIVTVSSNAQNQEGSSAYLKEKTKVKMENLLYALMLKSGNDAAVAIAEHIAGDTKQFAALMNQKAEQIGCKHTHFENPNGLDSENHYTTAADLAKITACAMANKEFVKYVSTKEKKIYNGSMDLYLTNHNKLLKTYEGCIGVKTGFTKKCGRCLVSAAERNGVRLICVTLNAPDDWNDHRAMLDASFPKVSSCTVTASNAYAATARIRYGSTNVCQTVYKDTVKVATTENTKSEIHLKIQWASNLKAPVKVGQKLGTAKVFLGTQCMGNTDLLANEPVCLPEKKSTRQEFKMLLRLFHGGLQTTGSDV